MPSERQRPPLEIVKEDYENMTNAAMAKKHDVAEGTIRKWVTHYNIKKKFEKLPCLVNTRFGCRTVVERLGVNKLGAIIWLVVCDCGTKRRMTTGHLRHSGTMSCGCQKYTGFGSMSGKYWSGVIQKAVMRGLEVSVTCEMAWNKYISQGGLCALSGLPICFGRDQTASFDRINSSLGYVATNIQWVHKRINIMKNKCLEEEFIYFCNAVTEHNRSSLIAA